MIDAQSSARPPRDGFTGRLRPSPLTDPWEPIHTRPLADRVDVGLWLREVHCNARGFVHGGLISALADNCMGHSGRAVLRQAEDEGGTGAVAGWCDGNKKEIARSDEMIAEFEQGGMDIAKLALANRYMRRLIIG